MAKLYNFAAYVIDANDDFTGAEEFIAHLKMVDKYCSIDTFNNKTVDIDWHDDIDINYCDCDQSDYDKYFEEE